MGVDIPEGHIKTFAGNVFCATCINGYKYVASCSQNTQLRCLVEKKLHKKPYELRRRRSLSEESFDCNHL